MSFALVLWIIGVSVCDFVWRRVPNSWVLAGALFAIGALASGNSPLSVTWREALIGGAGAFTMLLSFYMLGMMGAGDVKFAGVLGLWLGGPPLVPIAIGAGLLAGGHALFCLARRHGPMPLGGRRSSKGTGKGEGEAHVVVTTATGAGASTTDPVMDGAIPYAGYLALMALLWTALRLGTLPA